MTFKRAYERLGLKDGEGKLRIKRPVEANSTGGQGSRRAVAPSDDDDNDKCNNISVGASVRMTWGLFKGEGLRF
jgi:hypothetical protein